MNAFEYDHVVELEETSLVGNVYFANHLRWQGLCREQFLRQHAPEVIDALAAGFALVTTRCSCEYLAELTANDRLTVRMFLVELVQNRISMRFEYLRRRAAGVDELVARGEQQVACMRREAGQLVAAPVPVGLRAALRAYEAA